MSNQRTSNFKKKTATDTKQDEDISTLSTTLSGTISPNTINLGGVGGTTLNNVASELVINAYFDNRTSTLSS